MKLIINKLSLSNTALWRHSVYIKWYTNFLHKTAQSSAEDKHADSGSTGRTSNRVIQIERTCALFLSGVSPSRLSKRCGRYKSLPKEVGLVLRPSRKSVPAENGLRKDWQLCVQTCGWESFWSSICKLFKKVIQRFQESWHQLSSIY